MTNLDWIQGWYAQQCDGDWEHEYGVVVDTLDNPGWRLVVDVDGTDLEDKSFSEIVINRSKTDWVLCSVENSQFKGCGGPRNLTELISIFRSWAEARSDGQ